jgi:hypothetical protein
LNDADGDDVTRVKIENIRSLVGNCAVGLDRTAAVG